MRSDSVTGKVDPEAVNELIRLESIGRYELVKGRPRALNWPTLKHSWTTCRISSKLCSYLEAAEPDAYLGLGVMVPTGELTWRRAAVAYFSIEDAEKRVDFATDRFLGVPTLAVEVVDEGEEELDVVVKRQEYARAGVAHFWLLKPHTRSAQLLELEADAYIEAAALEIGDDLRSPLFPGFSVALTKLFRK